MISIVLYTRHPWKSSIFIINKVETRPTQGTCKTYRRLYDFEWEKASFYISMHENAFKKAVAKKNRVYVGNYLPQHPSQISYHDGSRLCGANLKP